MTIQELGANPNVKHEQRIKCKLCPPHKSSYDNSTDMSVNIAKNTYFCHRCNSKGFLQTDLVKFEKKEFKPLVKRPTLVSSSHKKMLEYFKSRGLNPRTVSWQGCYVSETYFKKLDSKELSIAFPDTLNNEVLQIEYRCIKEKQFAQEKNGTKIFSNIDKIQLDTKSVIICEGRIDAMSWYEATNQIALSIPSGGTKTDTNTKFEFLENCAEKLLGIDTFYLSFDNDEVGQSTQELLASRLGKEKCKIITLELKDANDVLVQQGKDALIKAYKEAKDYPIEGLQTADKYFDSVLDMFHGRVKQETFNLGVKCLDDNLKKIKGYVWTILAMPGTGKTTFSLQYMLLLAERHNQKFLIYSPEHSIEELIIKLCRQRIGTYFDKSQMEEEELKEAMQFVHKHFYFIGTPEGSVEMSIEEIHKICKYVHLKVGIDGILIDSFMKLNKPNLKDQSDIYQKMWNQLSHMARRMAIAVIVITHPTKEARNKTDLSLYDILGTSIAYNILDIGCILSRKNDKTLIEFAKMRNQANGNLCKESLYFDVQSERFYDDYDFYKQRDNRKFINESLDESDLNDVEIEFI